MQGVSRIRPDGRSREGSVVLLNPSTLLPTSANGAWVQGESAVLSLARRREATVVIDDRDARRAAKAMGLNLIGTLGVIIRARKERQIDSAAQVLRDLRNCGFRLDEALVAEALRQAVGETPA